MLDDLLVHLEGTHDELCNQAMAESDLGDVVAICATLRRVAAAHELLFITLPADPRFDRHRDHPLFIELMNEYDEDKATEVV